MAGGRPTDYRPEFCESIVDLGREGKSVAQMASEFDVSKQTLFNWADAHPDFLDAMTRAKTHAQAWWESQGQTNMLLAPGAGTFNGSVWSRSMAARFPDDWRENKGVELTGANGGAVETKTTLDMSGLSVEQLRAVASIPLN